MKLWQSVSPDVLKSLESPASGYEQFIDIPEFTFLGVHNQPDFGYIKIWFYAQDKTMELKSLKKYLLQYRNTVISYERCIHVMYTHLKAVYEPFRIRIEIVFRPRGGISSTMKADSDWGHFGGSDQLWQHHK